MPKRASGLLSSKRPPGPICERERERRDASDLAIIDANAERLNAEALDALDYQAAL